MSACGKSSKGPKPFSLPGPQKSSASPSPGTILGFCGYCNNLVEADLRTLRCLQCRRLVRIDRKED